MEPIRVYDNPPRDAWPALTARVTRDDAEIDRRVAAILNEVRTGGDEALRRIARRIEGFAPERFELPQAQLDEAARSISPELKTALATAKANIEAFHRAQLPRPVAVEVMPGVRCSQRAVAIRRVGLYVPGGSAPLFSTVLMLAVPAAIAGCAEIVLCTPAGRDGSIAPEIRYAAALCGVRRVFALGGAQAVAAMAYGTESVPTRSSGRATATSPAPSNSSAPKARPSTFRPDRRRCWCSPTKGPRPTSRPPTCSRRPNTAATVRRCSSAAPSRSHAA